MATKAYTKSELEDMEVADLEQLQSDLWDDAHAIKDKQRMVAEVRNRKTTEMNIENLRAAEAEREELVAAGRKALGREGNKTVTPETGRMNVKSKGGNN